MRRALSVIVICFAPSISRCVLLREEDEDDTTEVASLCNHGVDFDEQASSSPILLRFSDLLRIIIVIII